MELTDNSKIFIETVKCERLRCIAYGSIACEGCWHCKNNTMPRTQDNYIESILD